MVGFCRAEVGFYLVLVMLRSNFGQSDLCQCLDMVVFCRAYVGFCRAEVGFYLLLVMLRSDFGLADLY